DAGEAGEGIPGRAGGGGPRVTSRLVQCSIGCQMTRGLTPPARPDEPRPPLPVVEADDPVVQADGQVRGAKFVEPRPGNSFEGVAQAVAEQSREAALEWRQVWDGRDRLGRESAGKKGERVGV